MLKKKFSILFCLLCCTIQLHASACTLFAATGESFVEGGGTLVAKNRDEKAAHQELKVVHPNNGYTYYGLFSGKTATFNAAGINEKGLFVAMSTAGSIPTAERKTYPIYKDADGQRTNKHLLAHYASVDEVLASQEDLWHEPVNYIIADNTKVAYVEVAPDHTHAVKVQENGVLYHTNHYIEPETIAFNKKIGISSATRYNRIEELMTKHDGPFTFDDFITISEDQHDGPTCSIYRLGTSPTGTSTLASFIVYLPPTGSPVIYVKYRAEANEQGHERITGKEEVVNLLE